ncbi:MAG: serine/threonine protein kinase [Myxococcales bacterium]|nr:serine/threonine protein kinase [Myxococcales bacterium]
MWWRRSSSSPPPTTPPPDRTENCPGFLLQCPREDKICQACGYDQRGNDRLLGRSIGGFHLVERARDGLFGTVYLAQSAGRSNLSAFHLLRPTMLKNFPDLDGLRRRVAQWAELRHPGIAEVEAFGESQEGFYWATSWLHGVTLQHLLRGFPGGLPEALWADLTQQLLWVLDTAHTSGVVVGQLRPEHVLLLRRGRRFQLILVDIGCGPQRWTRELQALFAVNKLLSIGAYLPPEQMASLHTEIQPRSDLYTAGILLFQMITGRPPFRGRTWDDLYKKQRYRSFPRLQESQRPLPYAEALDELFGRALAKDPHHRYPSAQHFLDALTQLPLSEAQRRVAFGWDRAFWRSQKDLDNTKKLEALNAAREEITQLPEKLVVSSFPHESSPHLFSSQWLRASQIKSSASLSTSHPSIKPEKALEELQQTQQKLRVFWQSLGLALFFVLWWLWLWLFS